MNTILEASNHLHQLAQRGDTAAIIRILNLPNGTNLCLDDSDLEAYYSDGSQTKRAFLEAEGFKISVGSFLGFHLLKMPNGKAYEAQVIRRAQRHAETGVFDITSDDVVPDIASLLRAEKEKSLQQKAGVEAVIAGIRDAETPMNPEKRHIIQRGIQILILAGCKCAQGRGEEIVVHDLPRDELGAVTEAIQFFGVLHVTPDYNDFGGTAFLRLQQSPYRAAPEGTAKGVLARVLKETEKAAQQNQPFQANSDVKRGFMGLVRRLLGHLNAA